MFGRITHRVPHKAEKPWPLEKSANVEQTTAPKIICVASTSLTPRGSTLNPDRPARIIKPPLTSFNVFTSEAAQLSHRAPQDCHSGWTVCLLCENSGQWRPRTLYYPLILFPKSEDPHPWFFVFQFFFWSRLPRVMLLINFSACRTECFLFAINSAILSCSTPFNARSALACPISR